MDKNLSQVIDDMKEAINKLNVSDPSLLEVGRLIGMTEMLSIATGKRYKITKDGLSEETESESDTITDGEKLDKIKEIVERALRSEDAINQYKAKSLEEIAEILGIEIKEPEATEPDDKDQITIDDIIKEG